jgi:predicted xylose isomerase-like sugar epimerase
LKLKPPQDVKASDKARVKDLAEQHGLAFKRFGAIYQFEDFNAWNLDQALGYVEGYDRAMSDVKGKSADA